MAYLVYLSEDINQLDSIEFEGRRFSFELSKPNETNQNLIVLYMYVLPKFQTHGIKVGMATCHPDETFSHAIKKRIGEQEHELALSKEQFEKYGQEREVIYWGVCLDAKNESFKDYSVHKEILRENAGLTEKEQEWFINVPQDELISIFSKVREKGLKKEIYTPRKEQQECIDAMKGYFEKNPKGGRFLLNCKMRFGKSYTTYKFCEDAGLKKILILTFIPAVEASWKDDLSHIATDYKYFTDKDLRRPMFELYYEDSPYVLFLSLQNFLGKDKNSADVKKKIKKLKDEQFDLVILDEYHFGAWNKRTQERLEDFDSEYQKELGKTKDVIERFGIKTDKVLCLSGTPFKAIARGEFTKDNTYTYSYFDEQKNKYPNDDFEHPNPAYAHFPDMRIFGYNMSALFGNLTSQVFSEDKILGKKYFSLNRFFETRKDDNPEEPCSFIYEDEVKNWLEIIKGRSTYGNKFPYSRPEMLNNNKHTLWLLPTVNSCIAMASLLEKDEYFSRYKIINLSAPGVGSGVDAFDFLLDGIKEADNLNKLGSIALTVNKLTTGVTVKQWFSVFVLKDLASPEQYFQSVFRIQTPFKDGDTILKKTGFVYDFNIDRASALLLKYAEETSEESVTKLQIAKLIVKYLPIFMNGDMDKPIEYEVFYQLAQFGDQSNVPLSRKITNLEATTHALNEETMAEMLNDPEVSDIIKRVFAHSKLQKSKTRTILPKPEVDGFQTKVAKEGRDKGYSLGMDDSSSYLDYDDSEIQKSFEKHIESYLAEYMPKNYGENEKVWYTNGFKKGYEAGVNVPIKKLNCGYEDGKAFAAEVRKRFGDKVLYTKETRPMIENFVRPYLNDINNIPEQYRGMLYKRWYVESFLKGLKNELKPVIKDEKATSVEDTENVLRHILARLVEFLYISVYRETTFGEIFKNADPDVFLEAVGITKKDFDSLNKYHIFEENTLNNYIHEFFVNESIGSDLDSLKEDPNDQYRNSFGWFGYNEVMSLIKDYVAENNAKEVIKGIEEYAEGYSDTKSESELEGFESNEEIGDRVDAEPEKPSAAESKSGETEAEEAIESPDLKSRIAALMEKENGALKSGVIAKKLGVSKKDVNRVLYANKETFIQSLFTWKLRK